MRGREGLYGRPRGGEVVVFPQDISERNRYAGDHKGPPFPASAALAPTDVDEPFLRLMPLGRPPGSPVQYQLAHVTRHRVLYGRPWRSPCRPGSPIVCLALNFRVAILPAVAYSKCGDTHESISRSPLSVAFLIIYRTQFVVAHW